MIIYYHACDMSYLVRGGGGGVTSPTFLLGQGVQLFVEKRSHPDVRLFQNGEGGMDQKDIRTIKMGSTG